MKYGRQISSGGVLFRPADGGYEVAVIRLKGGKVYALPKGLVEEGEDPRDTAVREVREETGMEGEPVAPLGYIRYYYYSPEEDTRYFKLVHFYLLRYRGGSEEGHDREVEGVEWMPLRQAMEALSYKGERAVLERASAVLEGKGTENEPGERLEPEERPEP
jgi:8-oxo-dGTP pyrophosphatase MutT (NUDIX family)